MPRCVGQVPNKCGDIKSGVTATPADTWMSMPPSQQPSAQGLLQRVGLHGLMYVIRFTAITHVYSVRYLSVRFRRGQSYAISSVSRRVLGRLPAEAASSKCVPLGVNPLRSGGQPAYIPPVPSQKAERQFKVGGHMR